MRILFFLLALGSAAFSSTRAGDYSVNVAGKTTSTEAILVGKSWRTDIPSRFRVTLRSSKEHAGSNMVFRAYFFDADGNLIRKQKGPNLIWTGTKKGVEEVGMPETLKPGKIETVYLAIPEDVEKMKTLIVVFGLGEDLTCDVYPSSKKLEDFDFPEKAAIKN